MVCKQKGGIRLKKNSDFYTNYCSYCNEDVNKNGCILNCGCAMHLICFITYLKGAFRDKYQYFTENGLKCISQNHFNDLSKSFNIQELEQLLELLNTQYIKELLITNRNLNISANNYNSFKNNIGVKFRNRIQRNTRKVEFNLNNKTGLYKSIITSICPCGKFGGIHWQGHRCHSIHCGECRIEYCCKCSGVKEDVKNRFPNNDKYHLCTCGRNGTPFLHTFCTNGDSILEHIDRSKSRIPCDDRCGCAICPDCKPRKPCSECPGTCVVCKGIVPPGPDGLNNAEKWNVPVVEKSRCIITFKGHTKDVKSVAYSPDNRYIVSGSDDSSLVIWDIQLAKHVWVLKGHSSYVLSVGYSNDGRHIVSGSWDKSIRIWDVASGTCVKVLLGESSTIYTVSWSPDGSFIASGSFNNSIRIWDADISKHNYGTCLKTMQENSGPIWSVSWSPDSRHLVSGSEDGLLRIWDILSSTCIARLNGHEMGVMSVAYSKDGRFILSGSRDRTIRIWNAESGICIKVLSGHTNVVSSISWSYDDNLIVSGSWDKSVKVWEVFSEKCLATMLGHDSDVRSVAYSPNGQRVISGSKDTTVKVWDVSNLLEK